MESDSFNLKHPTVQVLSLPGSVLWATIFFVMLLVLGIDSEFCNVEALVTGMVDNWPDTLLKHRRLFTICLSAFLFCLGVPLVTNVTKYSQYPGHCVMTLLLLRAASTLSS